jgi:hypothetical protein
MIAIKYYYLQSSPKTFRLKAVQTLPSWFEETHGEVNLNSSIGIAHL